MKVSIDGGTTYQEAPDGVRVIYDDVDVWDGDRACTIEAELHVNCTHEGLIQDVIYFDEVGGTSSEMAQEIVDRLTG